MAGEPGGLPGPGCPAWLPGSGRVGRVLGVGGASGPCGVRSGRSGGSGSGESGHQRLDGPCEETRLELDRVEREHGEFEPQGRECAQAAAIGVEPLGTVVGAAIELDDHRSRQQQIQRHQRQQLLDKNQVKLILEMEQQLMG